MCFFFFKQKTAYEMRISDWSSDVCSSDLLRYSYRHSELPEGAIVVAARFKGQPGDAHAIQAEMDRISASREASQPLRSKTGGSTFKNPEGRKAWRSEEHTSELQSLMRISYAVFCLKKQKIKHTKINKHEQ